MHYSQETPSSREATDNPNAIAELDVETTVNKNAKRYDIDRSGEC